MLPRKIWMITKFALLVFAVFVFTIVAGGFGYRFHRQHEAAKTLVIRSVNGIDEGRFVKIGGIDQWIQIRGDDLDNPVLLILHGGPGASFVPLTKAFVPWEKYFTVVQWDQRGTGRTFGRDGADGSGEMSVERMVQDGIEVAEYLVHHLHHDKLILYGTSWGTLLGSNIAQRRPDLLYGYVGAGQLADVAEDDALGYAIVLRNATELHDAVARAALEAIGPPPYGDLAALDTERRWLLHYASPSDREVLRNVVWQVSLAPDYSIGDILDLKNGAAFSIKALFPELMSGKLRSPLAGFRVPVIVIQGADDVVTPTVLAKAYLAAIDAPRKEFIEIPAAGHFVFLAQPDRMLAEFLSHVRPLAAEAPH